MFLRHTDIHLPNPPSPSSFTPPLWRNVTVLALWLISAVTGWHLAASSAASYLLLQQGGPFSLMLPVLPGQDGINMHADTPPCSQASQNYSLRNHKHMRGNQKQITGRCHWLKERQTNKISLRGLVVFRFSQESSRSYVNAIRDDYFHLLIFIYIYLSLWDHYLTVQFSVF